MSVLSYRPEMGLLFGNNDSLVPLAGTAAFAKVYK
jgi:hypothetical protein